MDQHSAWVERDAAVVWHGFTQMSAFADNSPIIIERAEGRELIDVDGRRYLDAISSLWVVTLGHHVPELDAALRAQIDRVAHSTMLGNGNRITIELAEALAAVVPVDDPHFLFASDGAAAVEQALKIAFQYWTNQGITTRTSYLAFGGAYHGDTFGSLSVGDGGFGTDVFDPLRFPVRRVASGDTAAAVAAIEQHAGELAAVVLEPLVQGASGMVLNEPSFVRAVADACAQHDVLLVCDEVATGFGRTGTLFAVEQCGVRPDLLCLGKGLTGGYLAMAATVASRRVYDAFLGPDLSDKTLYHGHSFSGNALAAAVALRHLELIAECNVLDNVRARSEQLRAALAAAVAPLAGVTAIRQRGLMTGIELAPPTDGLRWGRRVSAACVRRGVLIRPLGDVIVLMPPLTITADEIDRIVDTVKAAIEEVCAVVTDGWRERIEARNRAIADAGQWRTLRTLDGPGPAFTIDDGRAIVSFASNDYLGLSQHPSVVGTAADALKQWGTGSGSARLIVGSRPVHRDLERDLAEWKHTEAALLFPTGFAANLGVITTFATAGVLVISDELNHASIIDGCRLSRGRVEIARHRDVEHVDALLDAHDGPAIVVTDTVFSMDGDEARLDDLFEVCGRHGALVVVDEAHAVLGPDVPEYPNLLRVGTLSKTLGSLGGFVAGPRAYIDLIVNAARPFIFTTAPTPADTAAAAAALRLLRSDEGVALVARLRAHVERIAPGHPSPIVPIVLGDEQLAMDASKQLLDDHGLLVPAIRPPTVAPGTSRLRIALSAAHSDDDVDRLAKALIEL